MVGENIRKIRMDRKISINRLSKLSGVSLGFLSDIENNKNSPSLATLDKIAKALNVSLEDFFKGEGSELTTAEVLRQSDEVDKVYDEIIEKLKTATPEQKKKILDIIGIIKEE